MKSKRTFKEKMYELAKNQTKLLKRSMLIGITVAAASFLSGCQEEKAFIETKPSNHPAFIKETTPSIATAQLESKVTLDNEFNAGVIRSSNFEDIDVSILKDAMTTLYENKPIHKVEFNKETWKDSYDGIGVPLLKISF